MNPLHLLLDRLRAQNCDPRKQANGGWSSKCPAHDDAKASLTIGEGDGGRVLLACHAGCAVEDVVSGLGLAMKDLFLTGRGSARTPRDAATAANLKSKGPRSLVREIPYVILDEPGNRVEHVRREYADGSKDFVWRRNGKSGLDGLRVEDLPLYGIGDVKAALAASPSEPPVVLVVEGEKKREELKTKGYLAVATATGAGICPSWASIADLVGCKVLLWADNDAPGRSHMDQNAATFLAVCESIPAGHAPRFPRAFLLHWPEAPASGDAADFFESGNSPAQLDALIARAAESTPNREAVRAAIERRKRGKLRFRSVAELEREGGEGHRWICQSLLARSCVTLLVGKPKAGKSTLVLALLQALEAGQPFVGLPTQPSVAVLVSEESVSTLVQKLNRFGVKRVRVLSRADAFPRRSFAEVVEAAIREAQNSGAALIVIDTYAFWSSLVPEGEQDAGATQGALDPVLKAASEGFAVLLVHHMRKAQGEEGDAVRGSSALAASVDFVVELRRTGKENPDHRCLTILGRHAEPPPDLVVRLAGDGFETVGTREEVATRNLEEQILISLPIAPAPPLESKQVHERVEGRAKDVSAALSALFSSGRIEREGTGKKGAPYRYRRPAKDSIPDSCSHRGGTESASASERISPGPGSGELAVDSIPDAPESNSPGTTPSEAPEGSAVRVASTNSIPDSIPTFTPSAGIESGLPETRGLQPAPRPLDPASPIPVGGPESDAPSAGPCRDAVRTAPRQVVRVRVA